MKFTARLRKIAKVTKWEQSQGKIVVKLIDKGYINNYIGYLCKYCKKKLDREIEKGYNINVSSYAIGTLDATEYDETYTEYRVQKWIEGGIMR